MDDATIKFVVPDDGADEMKRILKAVYASLNEKGYNPINQIVGYLLSEDPTYIILSSVFSHPIPRTRTNCDIQGNIGYNL